MPLQLATKIFLVFYFISVYIYFILRNENICYGFNAS